MQRTVDTASPVTTYLHDETYCKDLKGQRHVNIEDTTQNHTLATSSAMSLHVAREGQSVSTSMIVPVWVSNLQTHAKKNLYMHC